MLNDLRSRVILQADGQLRTGLDVVMAAMLGADEFGFATAPLITLGCIMMRKCHLNTCPVGIATQDPELRAKFVGKPEHVINYFFLMAEEIRDIMAKLGFRSFSELIGRTDKLKARTTGANFKEASLNYDSILVNAQSLRPGASIRGGSVAQSFELEKRLDMQVIERARDVLEGRSSRVDAEFNITNQDRTFGATLSNEISLRYKEKGLADDSIYIRLRGSAGQSFGAFLARGVTLELCGDANDYIGKGLSGGKIIIYPPTSSPFETVDAIIVGNVVLYGAITGTLYLRGQAAERFCVRNSGATAVSEGCGDHGCEYMTGGVCVLLGLTGRNFAAGMSGGVAYVYDPTGVFPPKCNKESVTLFKVVEDDDLAFLKSILTDFHDKTGSKVAKSILDGWPLTTSSFIKVFPNEYRKVLEEEKRQRYRSGSATSIDLPTSPTTTTAAAADASTAVALAAASQPQQVADIEDSFKTLDKVKGFHKYKRSEAQYRPAGERVNDWEEIFNHSGVKRGLKQQAARCMDCGVPFCQSKDGCPLGNIIPKWNDLVFQVNICTKTCLTLFFQKRSIKNSFLDNLTSES